MRDIICYNCGKKGHKSTVCPVAVVNYTSTAEDHQIFLTEIDTFNPTDQDIFPDGHPTDNAVLVLSSATNKVSDNVIMLDT